MIYDTNNLARVALDSLTDQCVSFVADFADRHTNPQPVGESGWKTTLKELRHTIPGSLFRSRDESKFFEVPKKSCVRAHKDSFKVKIAPWGASDQAEWWSEEKIDEEIGDGVLGFLGGSSRWGGAPPSTSAEGEVRFVVGSATGGLVRVFNESRGQTDSMEIEDAMTMLGLEWQPHSDTAPEAPPELPSADEVAAARGHEQVKSAVSTDPLSADLVRALKELGCTMDADGIPTVKGVADLVGGLTGLFDASATLTAREVLYVEASDAEAPPQGLWFALRELREAVGESVWSVSEAAAVDRLLSMPEAVRGRWTGGMHLAQALIERAAPPAEASGQPGGSAGDGSRCEEEAPAAGDGEAERAGARQAAPAGRMRGTAQWPFDITEEERLRHRTPRVEATLGEAARALEAGGPVEAPEQSLLSLTPPINEDGETFLIGAQDSLLPIEAGPPGTWIPALAVPSLRKGVADTAGCPIFGADDENDAGLDLLMQLNMLLDELRVHHPTMGYTSRPRSWMVAGTRIGCVRRAVQQLRGASGGGDRRTPSSARLVSGSGASATMHPGGLDHQGVVTGTARVERLPESATEETRCRAVGAEVLAPLSNPATLSQALATGSSVETAAQAAAAMANFDGTWHLAHSNGKALTAISNAGVPPIAHAARTFLYTQVRENGQLVAGEARSRSAENAAKNAKVALAVQCGDIKLDEFVEQFGGARSTIAFVITTGGTGAGRAGTTTGPTAGTDIIQAMGHLERLLIFTFISCCGPTFTHPNDAHLLPCATPSCLESRQGFGLQQLARDADAAVSLTHMKEAINFFLARLRRWAEEKRHRGGKTLFSFTDEVLYTRANALGPLIHYQQTEEVVERSVAALLANQRASAAAKRPDVFASSQEAPRKAHRGARGGAGRGAGAAGAAGQEATPGQTRLPSRDARGSEANPPGQQAATHRPGAQVEAGAQVLRQMQADAQQQRVAATGSSGAAAGGAATQGPAPARPQAQAQTSGQSQRLGGARGRLSAIEELDARYYAGTPRDQRPCAWKGLFGACAKEACPRCATGLEVPLAQVRAIERLCEPSLAQQIRAARP
jgi:hypothetical protein